MDSSLMMNASIEPASGAGHAVAGQVKRLPPRRQYTLQFKRQIVEETFAPGQSVSIVARRHDVNANLLFDWRKRYRDGTLGGKLVKTAAGTSDLLRIGVVEADGRMRALPPVSSSSILSPAPPRPQEPAMPESQCLGRVAGIVEIELKSGIKVRVDAGIDEAALRRVLAVVGASA